MGRRSGYKHNWRYHHQFRNVPYSSASRRSFREQACPWRCFFPLQNLFKLGHNREQLSRNVAHVPFKESPRAWLSAPGRLLWLTGLLLFITGNVLNFVSFAFAAQSLLAALAAVQFLANVVFARLLNGERAPRGVLLATGVVVVGCVLLVAFGNHASPVLDASALLELYASPGYIAYICTLVAFTAAVALFYRHGSRKLRRAAAHEESL
ncbi:hypothetical protein H632_c1832p0, partial [Helicosporidium sp. ATCC 50920]